MNRLQQLSFNILKYPTLKLEDVFTPAVAAKENYIEREDIDSLLSSEMQTPGKQIIIFGHSGSGKTSSVRYLLNRSKYSYVRTHCESNTTFEQLILNVFDELNPYILSNKTIAHKYAHRREMAVEYNNIKASLAQETNSEESKVYTRVLPLQLTPQKLAQFMGQYNLVWIIEDFHKVSAKEKVRIADVIKIFVDNANDYSLSKIICIGACQSAHDLIKLDPNLRTRVSELSVPLLKDEEIKKIIDNGFYLLNIEPDKSLVEKLVYYSDRLGSFAHQMCMDICKGLGIRKTNFRKKHVGDDAFQFAVNGFIMRSSDTFKSMYEAAVKNELGWYILKTFSHNAKEKLSLKEICKRVNHGKVSFSEDEIIAKLEELMSPAFNIIYFNLNSEKYALSTPFWHSFLRIQFGIEKAQQIQKNKNRHNPNLKLVDKKSKYYDVDKRMEEVVRELNTFRS